MKKNNYSINLIRCFICFFLLSFFSFYSNAYPAASSYFDTVQKIYIGYYQRPADPGGLIYWAGRLDNSGGNLTEIIEAFANSPESQALYGPINSTNISTVVNDIYIALLARNAEDAGLNYYVGEFNAGRFTSATIMLNILDGATQGSDLLSINNKLSAANLFTRTIDPELDGLNFQAAYTGDGDNIAGRNFLSFVTSDPATARTQTGTTAYIQTNIADPGDAINTNTPEDMVLIPAGSFQMGDAIDGMSNAMPVHTVTVSAFYLDKYEVTRVLWDEVYIWATAHGYSFDNAGLGTAANHPIHTVSWYDVVKWLNARSEKETRTPVYYTDADQATVYRAGQVDVAAGAVKWSTNGYRLPTEAELEYAVRAGTATRFYTGDYISTGQASYDVNNPDSGGCSAGQYSGGTTAVGSFAANLWGLYDMVGNVWEMVWDWYGSYSSSSAINPKGPDSGSNRVGRSGSWCNNVNNLRSAYRGSNKPTKQDYNVGFRSALSQS